MHQRQTQTTAEKAKMPLILLIDAYKKRVMNKTKMDEKKMDELLKLSLSASPRGILKKLKEMERAFY